MHVQFENSCKKKQKCIFNFEIHTKKDKNGSTFFWIFFCFLKAEMQKKDAKKVGGCIIKEHKKKKTKGMDII